MALILNIDCAVENASVCLCCNEEMLAFEKSAEQKNHASFLQPSIQNVFLKTNLSLPQIDAVAVTIGPGSYTGLRVGLASAKGLCYALQKPLIVINTLEVIAHASMNKFEEQIFFCPMIDARRMEVFTALYDRNLNVLMQPCAMILNENSFENELKSNNIVFCGNGSNKFKTIQRNTAALFADVVYDARDLIFFSTNKFYGKQFADIAYINPFYLKDFFAPEKKNK